MSKKKAERDPLDRYYTPAWATEALLQNWPFPEQIKTIWEPCAGKGHIVKVLAPHFVVMCSDVDRAAIGYRHNFLEDWAGPKVSDRLADAIVNAKAERSLAIVTNPPYSIPGATAADFVRAALQETRYVAMLLRISWLEPCADRVELFRKNPPSQILVLPRVHYEGPNVKKKNANATSAWFVWKPSTKGTEVKWIL